MRVTRSFGVGIGLAAAGLAILGAADATRMVAVASAIDLTRAQLATVRTAELYGWACLEFGAAALGWWLAGHPWACPAPPRPGPEADFADPPE